MSAPRNELEAWQQTQPHEKVRVKFAGAMRPAPRRKSKPRRLSLWQRIINHPVFDAFKFTP